VAFRVEFAADAERDLELILDHLIASHVAFGEPEDEALDRAARRIRAIRRAADGLGRAPHQGTRHPALAPGLRPVPRQVPRHVTIDRAIYWFTVDEDAATVRVLAVFFGGADHIRRMMVRLLGE
jgi:toxin ParE1/3/4